MSARDHIFARLRHAQAPTPGSLDLAITAHTITDEHTERIGAFIKRAEASGVTVQRACDKKQLTTLLQASLGEHRDNININLNKKNSFTIARGDDFTVTYADAGIAETGTICIHSHQIASQSLFLCEHLLVVLPEASILAYQEDYWATQTGDIPRAVHLITGPSRTADVEQTIQIGAHGPRFMTLFLLGA